MKASRTRWGHFPDAVILAPVKEVKGHTSYPLAKEAGDGAASEDLVEHFVDGQALKKVEELIGNHRPILVSVHAIETKDGNEEINAIPEVLAVFLGDQLSLEIESTIIQTNVVSHTGARGDERLARQALFDGTVIAGQEYLIVDDFIAQGGTIANLRGFIESHLGKVIGAVALTGKPVSAILGLQQETLLQLRERHGELETWWQEYFGFAFDCLTESEARYLIKIEDANAIRNRIFAAEQADAGNDGQGDSES